MKAEDYKVTGTIKLQNVATHEDFGKKIILRMSWKM